MSGTGRISSVHNPRVASAARLRRARERRSTGRMLVEGPHLLAEAVAGGIAVETVFAVADDSGARRLAREAGAELVEVTDPVLRRLAVTESPRGPVAVAVIPAPRSPDGDVLWVDVGDPGNAGTLVRTAAAFSYGVSFGPRAAEVWSPKVLRASAGAAFRVAIAADGGLPRDAVTVATVPRGGLDVRQAAEVLDPTRRWAILVGDEAGGLDLDTVDRADVRIGIPMPGGTESLNAAVAGAIVTYELWRVRNTSGPDPGGG